MVNRCATMILPSAAVHTQALPVIKGLLDKLWGSVKELEGEESEDGIQQHYQNTLEHITHTKANDSGLYADIEV